MVLILLILGALIEIGLIGFTGYTYFMGDMKLTILLGAVTMVYTIFYVMMAILWEEVSGSSYKSSSKSSSSGFDCDAGDMDCGDGGGGGFSGGD